jgi:SPP1 family predicted phage head-tail adaptor
MPLKSGELRHRIIIEANTPVERATSGAPKANWVPVCTRWAAMAPQAGREFYAAKQMHAETTHLIRMRGPLDVQTSMRARLGNRVFDILSVIDVEERHREMRLICKEGPRQGS